MNDSPDWLCAFVEEQKLTGYLLNENHADGKSKAKLLRGHDFDESNIHELQQGLIYLAQTNPVAKTEPTPFGVKYIVDGDLATPNGSILRLRTVWIVDAGEVCPRLVTTYPA